MKKILFFTAPWCAGCKTLKPQIQELPGIEYIDVDNFPATAMQYEVMALPTLVLIDDTGVVERITGASKRAVDAAKAFLS